MLTIVFIVGFLTTKLLVSNVKGNQGPNGILTTIEEHPYMLQLKHIHRPMESCPATLIRPFIALTCASCVVEFSRHELVIGGGSSDFSKKDVVWNRVIVILPHRDFEIYKHDYDLAVLIISPFAMAVNIQPIDYTPKEYEISPGTLGNVSGYGVVARSFGHKLRYATLSRLSNNECHKIWQDQFKDHMLCFTDNNNSRFYTGDFGGPLVINNTLAGVSVSRPRSNPTKPGIYLSLQSKVFRPFIDYILNSSLKHLFEDNYP